MVGCGGRPPIEIRDWYDLDAIRDNLGGHHILMNDLDSTTAGYAELASETANQGKGWEPIGTLDDEFTGIFDGQGYEISDLFINRPDEYYVGLFGYVNGGVIQDVGVVNADVTGGVLVGGLVGANSGTVGNSYSSGNVTGYWRVGGLVGGYKGTVSNSYSSANVAGDVSVGGLVGYYSGTVSNCYSTGNVTGSLEVGGLMGINLDNGVVSNCYSTGNVTGSPSAGGLVGHSVDGTVSNSFWDTETSGQSTSAGGTGKNTTEMKDITTFSGATWDIIAVANPSTRNPSYTWNIVDDETYPFLSWQP